MVGGDPLDARLADAGLDGLAVVALGGNVADARGGPAERLEAALLCFSGHGLHVVKRSGWWTSQAWPDPRDPPFVNGVALVRTGLEPAAVLRGRVTDRGTEPD